MRAVAAPRVHLFVCANRREGSGASELGPGCGDRGDALYAACKREVSRRGLVTTVWVTKTHCLGICPKHGATVARWPEAKPSAILADVEPEDAAALIEGAEPDMVTSELDALEELQRGKVLDLARRLKPGLTLEDIQNPHDFPELADPDWHYADGVLTGIQSVRAALRASRRR
jgi:predicted metal-binding protein